MTAVCGGGASGPKVGVAAVVDYSAGLLAAIFAAYDIAWLIPVIPLVGLAPLTLNTFCASDPPAIPTFTAAETNALIGLQFGADFDSGLAKLKNLILNTIWYDACQCNSGALTPFAPPAAPTGTPITQFPRGATVAPCGSYTSTGITITGVQSFSNRAFVLLTDKVATSFKVSDTTAISSGAGVGVKYTIQETVNGAATTTMTTDVFPASGYHEFVGQIVNRNASEIHINVTAQGGAGVSTNQPKLDVYCNGDNPTEPTQQPCCPPDPSTQSYLDNILQLVTLIQRQVAPFAYVSGAAHGPLTGTGQLDISGLLGVKVLPSSIPGWAGVQAGDPDALWLDSWVTWGNGDGWTNREFLRSSPFVSLPALAGQYTKLGYSLADGLAVTITELLREP